MDTDQDHEDLLQLSLSIGPSNPTQQLPPQLPPQPQPQPVVYQAEPLAFFNFATLPPPAGIHMSVPSQEIPGPSSRRIRRAPAQTLKQGKNETVPEPYPWATASRATVHSMNYLLSNGIKRVSGTVQCKRCEKQYEIEYDLVEKFGELSKLIIKNKGSMHCRAPSYWMNPTLPNCKFCNQSNCVRPVISKKRSINWLFLLLGQMLGCCKLAELKYFCKHTKNHRTGAKDRVLYLTYLGLCKQLDPSGPFDVSI